MPFPITFGAIETIKTDFRAVPNQQQRFEDSAGQEYSRLQAADPFLELNNDSFRSNFASTGERIDLVLLLDEESHAAGIHRLVINILVEGEKKFSVFPTRDSLLIEGAGPRLAELVRNGIRDALKRSRN